MIKVIILDKNTDNVVVLTLTEKTTVTPVSYVVEFISEQTKDSYYTLLGSNQSSYTTRFDEFTITETASPNTVNAEIELSVGSYDYKVWQTSDSTIFWTNASNITSAVTKSVIEYGKAVCKDTPASNTEYSGATSTNVIYEG